MEIAHNADLELTSGTVSLSFIADEVSGSHALFSKDASGQAHGGQLTVAVVNGRVKARLQ